MIGLLGSLLGGRGGRMLGSMVGGRTGGMIGGLAGAMLGGRQLRNLGGLVSRFTGGDDHKDAPESSIDDAQAEILIKVMCNSAKADGHVDEAEAEAIVSELGDVDDRERAFLTAELRAPHVQASDIARTVPANLANEAYAVSLIAINVDTMEEASYLRDLAEALGIDEGSRDDIHHDLGVAPL